MPQLPHAIELHDSHLTTIGRESGNLILKFRPAYVHRNGKGWSQDADLIVGFGDVAPSSPELPAHIADGTLKTTDEPYHNLLYLPLRSIGPIDLQLELFSGTVIRVRGQSVEVKLHGEAKYVEDFT